MRIESNKAIERRWDPNRLFWFAPDDVFGYVREVGYFGSGNMLTCDAVVGIEAGGGCGKSDDGCADVEVDVVVVPDQMLSLPGEEEDVEIEESNSAVARPASRTVSEWRNTRRAAY